MGNALLTMTVLEDILSNISELPDLEIVDNELIEITIDHDLSEL